MTESKKWLSFKTLAVVGAGVGAFTTGLAAFVGNIEKIVPSSSTIQVSNVHVSSPRRSATDVTHFSALVSGDYRKVGVLPLGGCHAEISLPNRPQIYFYPAKGGMEQFEPGWFNEVSGFMQFIEFEQASIQLFSFGRKDGTLAKAKARVKCQNIATEWEEVDIPPVYQPDT